MNFDFSEDQRVIQKAARDFLADRCPLERVREIFESDASYDEPLWKGAAEMGWLGAVVPESYGGAGLGHLELALIAEEVGRALAPLPFSSSVYLAVEALLLAGSEAQKERYLPRLASGELIGCFAFEERAGQVGVSNLRTTLARGRLDGMKCPVLDGDVAGLAVVVCRGGGEPALALAELGSDGVKRDRLESFDPSRSQARITFSGAPAERLEGSGVALLETLQQRAAVLMAFEQIGGAQRCLDLARDFAMGRYAFGRPIASFQAIKHKLADMFVAVELARSNGYYGAWALSSGSEELPIAACLARISACEAFETAAEENLQTHGGVGFTWEYDCHLFLRRAKLLSLALGSARRWKHDLVARLAASPAA